MWTRVIQQKAIQQFRAHLVASENSIVCATRDPEVDHLRSEIRHSFSPNLRVQKERAQAKLPVQIDFIIPNSHSAISNYYWKWFCVEKVKRNSKMIWNRWKISWTNQYNLCDHFQDKFGAKLICASEGFSAVFSSLQRSLTSWTNDCFI